MLDSQLALGLFPKPLKQMSNFYQPLFPKASELVLQFIEQLSHTQGYKRSAQQDESEKVVKPQSLYIYGDAGTGKTHLTQAISEALNERGVYALYLPLKTLVHQSSEMLEGARYADCLCIDDVELLALAPTEWQIEIFALLNEAIEQRKPWVCSGGKPLTELDTGLADLNSRIKLGAQVSLDAVFRDDVYFDFVQWLCELKMINITDAQINYLCQRVPRDIGVIVDIIDQLDFVLWQNHKALNYKFLNEFLEKELKK